MGDAAQGHAAVEGGLQRCLGREGTRDSSFRQGVGEQAQLAAIKQLHAVAARHLQGAEEHLTRVHGVILVEQHPAATRPRCDKLRGPRGPQPLADGRPCDEGHHAAIGGECLHAVSRHGYPAILRLRARVQQRHRRAEVGMPDGAVGLKHGPAAIHAPGQRGQSQNTQQRGGQSRASQPLEGNGDERRQPQRQQRQRPD